MSRTRTTKKSFTKVANATVQGTSKPFDANGLLIRSLSRPETWEHNITQMVNAKYGCRKTLNNLIDILVAAGCCVKTKFPGPKGKSLGGEVVLEFFDDPEACQARCKEIAESNGQPKKAAVSRTRTKSSRFFLISNATAQADYLSLAALGLLGYCLSMPENWYFSPELIKKTGVCSSVKKIRSLLNELIEEGHCLRVRAPNPKSKNLYGKSFYEIFDDLEACEARYQELLKTEGWFVKGSLKFSTNHEKNQKGIATRKPKAQAAKPKVTDEDARPVKCEKCIQEASAKQVPQPQAFFGKVEKVPQNKKIPKKKRDKKTTREASLPVNTKSLIAKNAVKPAAVVFSIFDSIDWLSEGYKRWICSKYTEKQVIQALSAYHQAKDNIRCKEAWFTAALKKGYEPADTRTPNEKMADELQEIYKAVHPKAYKLNILLRSTKNNMWANDSRLGWEERSIPSITKMEFEGYFTTARELLESMGISQERMAC